MSWLARLRVAPAVLDVLGLLLECLAVLGPAHLLFGVRYGHVNLKPSHPMDDLLQPGADTVVFLGNLSILLPILALPFVGIAYHLVRKRQGQDRFFPRRSLFLRPALWGLFGLGSCLYLKTMGWTLISLLPLLWLFVLNTLLFGAVHNLLLDRYLRSIAPKDQHPLSQFATRYTSEILRATLLTSALALLSTIPFVPFNLEQFQVALRSLPGLLLVLLYGGYRLGLRLRQPIKDYLILSGAYGPEKPSTQREEIPSSLAVRMMHAAHSLPYQLGAAMITASLIAAAAVLLLFRPLLGLPSESVLLGLGIAIAVTTAASTYAVIWHRHTLRPLLAHLEKEPPLQKLQVPTALSLTRKMVLAFGLPVLCICLLSLFWSFMEYKTLANYHIQGFARRRLDQILGVARKAEDLHSKRDSAEVSAWLGSVAKELLIHKEAIVYYVHPGEGRATVVAAPEGVSAPPLPRYAVAYLRQRFLGQLDIQVERLTGEYERVSEHLGALAVLYPNYRHPGFGGQEPTIPVKGQLIGLFFFFAVQSLLSAGIVVFIAVDLARPVRYLERRAVAMAKGDLGHPVSQAAVDVDEVGRLSLAFEEMRRGLYDLLRSSTELNLHLEAEVARRTAEISRRNQEVSETLSQLGKMRDELLRTEKLATMGRIAAEVTSEINNPVNVTVTMTEPIAEQLDEIDRLRASEPLPREEIQAALFELRRMVDVLLRGAQRAKEIVRATRIYARLSDNQPGSFDLNQVVDEVLQLFAELPRYGVSIVREYGGGLQVHSVRSDVAQLLSRWLAETTPRLRPDDRDRALPTPQVRVMAKAVKEATGPFVVLEILDNGPPLPEAALRSIRESRVAAFFGEQLQVESGDVTRLRLQLTMPPGAKPRFS